MKVFIWIFGALSALSLIGASAFVYAYLGSFGFTEFLHAVGLWIIYEVIVVLPLAGFISLTIRLVLIIRNKIG